MRESGGRPGRRGAGVRRRGRGAERAARRGCGPRCTWSRSTAGWRPSWRRSAARPNVSLHWGDAMKLDLAALEPAPGIVVSNLPYSVATPLILRTIEELPGVDRWTVMVQLEVAERLRAAPGSRVYGAPSVLVQLAAEVELTRRVAARGVRAPPAGRVGAAAACGAPAPAASRADARAGPRRRSPTAASRLPRSLELARAGTPGGRPRGAASSSGSRRTPARKRSPRRSSPLSLRSSVQRLATSDQRLASTRPRQAQPLPLPRPAPRRRAARDPLAVRAALARRRDRGERGAGGRGGLP